MDKWKRTIFFWVLVLLFLITVPTIILNAKGYRFDKNRGVFVHSGTITFKSNPQAVEVKVDDEIFESKKLNRINNSLNLSGIIPGEHTLKISADGFQSWGKKINIHSGVATEFWNVLLVRNNYEKINLNASGIEKFFISPKNDLLAYIVNSNKDLGIKILNLETDLVEQEFNFTDWEFIDDAKKENIEWSPDNSFLSIPVKRQVETSYEYSYFIYDFEKETNLNLPELLDKKDINDVRWDPKDNGFLFFLEGNTLFRVNIKNPKEIILIADNVSSYDLSGSYVHYAKDSGLLFRNNLNGSGDPFQITSNSPWGEDFKVSRIAIYDEGRIAIILNNKDFYIFNEGEHGDYFRKLADDIEEAHFSNDGKKILFWSNNEIFVYFLRDQFSQPIRQEDEMYTITRYSEPIKNVQWFKDYEHIIFNSGSWIKIIEIDIRDRANSMDLVNTKNKNPFVIYNNSLEKLYFIDTSNLYSLDFPEKTTIFGVEIGG